ncbi:sigma-E factor negative regulatory protein [Marinagarivorans algicola]|uniref:sigma-E factor negative regulatory protein n=1 Tax=Marinagarivorans algicola TaxID=1513270 RepID=UPI0037355F5C
MAPITTHYAEPSEQTLEGLSALTDGETSAFEGRRLLNMANDPELEAKWQSYHLAGALMRKELEGAPLKDLSVSIATALADEPVFSASLNQPDATELSASISNRVDRSHSTGRLSSTNSLLGGRWRDFAAKSAIAASVAFAIVVGVQYTQTDGVGDVNTGEEFAVQSAPVVTAPSGFNVPSPVARNVSLGSLAEPQRELQSAQPSQHQFLSNAQVEAELQQLFLEHAELSSQNGKFGLMPMARAAKMQSAEK